MPAFILNHISSNLLNSRNSYHKQQAGLSGWLIHAQHMHIRYTKILPVFRAAESKVRSLNDKTTLKRKYQLSIYYYYYYYLKLILKIISITIVIISLLLLLRVLYYYHSLLLFSLEGGFKVCRAANFKIVKQMLIYHPLL